ncbi:MAG: TraB/GumN family protein [Methanimicrococcus sp.]|nr:TraB/GumN family protein [Methanimicrococcus sp.]
MKNEENSTPDQNSSDFNSSVSDSSSEIFVADYSISDSSASDSSAQDSDTDLSSEPSAGSSDSSDSSSDTEVSDINNSVPVPVLMPVPIENMDNMDNMISISEEEAEGVANPSKIIIIGTAHISQKSVQEVRESIERERPDIVAVELDQNRYKGMTDPDANKDQQISFKEILKPGQTFYYLLYSFLAYIQKKMGEQMGVPPGSEMFAAIEGAQEVGAGLSLIDRDIQVTFKRFLAKLSFAEKLKMVYNIVKGMIFGGEMDQEIDINNMTNQDVVTAMIEEFRKFAPTAASVLIDERDAYLAGSILKTVQLAGPGKKIVVVIGAGHRQGVMDYLQNPSKIPDLKELNVIPKKRISILKLISWAIIALVFLSFAYIVYSIITYPEMTTDVLILAFAVWFLINGVLSAAGVILAGGKLRSALVAFLLAWFTSFNPFLAAGWFAGLAEAGSRKPTTKDMKDMMNIETFKELNRNSFFKVIYVAALANVGSMIGTFVGAYLVFRISGIDFIELVKTVISGIFTLL